MWVLHGCTLLLSGIERDGRLPGIHIEFSKGGTSNGLNRVFTTTRLRGLLERKACSSVDKAFPFVTAMID